MAVVTAEQRLKRFHFDSQEQFELHTGYKEPTGFPLPRHHYRVVVEAINQYVEDAYFWTIDELRQGWSFNTFHKITDAFAASAGSSFFGVSEQRLGLQQDKAAQYLRGISEMTKALFQLVRELRIIDERLGYYKHTFGRSSSQDSIGSEITLKGIWIDQVEGGVKNAGSVYGLANTVGFTVLPDLFFRVRADDINADKQAEKDFDATIKRITDSLDKNIASMEGFNEKVKEVLNRKLTQYYVWKIRTHKELQTRRNFTIKYLRQHYETIKLYMGWIKPYLRNIKYLQLDEKRMDSADLISSFEGATMEIEVMAVKKRPGRHMHPVVLCHWFYRTRPALNYQQEGYQRGPAHTGIFDMNLRGYVWSDNQIQNYINMKKDEDLDLLSAINDSVKDAMEALGDDLKHYLKDQGEEFEHKKKDEHKKQTALGTLFQPFTQAAKGVRDLTSNLALVGKFFKKGDGHNLPADLELEEQEEVSAEELKRVIYQTYKNYKKLHGMLTW